MYLSIRKDLVWTLDRDPIHLGRGMCSPHALGVISLFIVSLFYLLMHHIVLLDRLKQCQLEKSSCNETIRKLGQQLADKDAKRYVQHFHLN